MSPSRPGLRGLVVLALAGGLLGCVAAPPDLDDVAALPQVIGERASIRYRDLERRAVLPLLAAVAATCSASEAHLGRRPPQPELVLYSPGGARPARRVRETRTALWREGSTWRLRFVYPWEDQPALTGQLLATTAHELAEATVFTQVVTLDPYLRWMHDGMAELVEHLVLRELRPAEARADLARAAEFLAERRRAGTLWMNLARWRQLAGYLVRSWRFLGPRESNLSLDDLAGSRARVTQARARDPQAPALDELDLILARCQELEGAPWARGEARPDDPRIRDYAFYSGAFAYWLALERVRPGIVERVLEALAARRAAGDLVLGAGEFRALLRELVGEEPGLSLECLQLQVAERVLRAELASLPR